MTPSRFQHALLYLLNLENHKCIIYSKYKLKIFSLKKKKDDALGRLVWRGLKIGLDEGKPLSGCSYQNERTVRAT